MNTLYLRIPSRHSRSWPKGPLSFALCKEEGTILREGLSTLSELAGSISKSTVVLLIAAADVTLLELAIPPMAEAKLKLALPNLVEDQLMSDSKECVLQLVGKPAATAKKRAVAVAQRSWLQQLSDQLFAMEARQVRALPEQLCLPWKSGQTSIQLDDQSGEADLALRFAEYGGIGMLQDPTQSMEDRISTAVMLAPPGPVVLHVPKQSLDVCKTALRSHPTLEERCAVKEMNWPETLQVARSTSLNLMAGLNASQTNRVQWRQWRWPLVLVALVLLINIAALNYDYWNLKREAQRLKQSMLQTYKTSFPKDSVVVFPLEQMKKNLDNAQRSSGQSSPDDFTLLLSQFGAVWSSINPTQLPKLISIEYKDRGLVLQVKGDLPQKDLETALEAKDLVLKKNNADVWTVRNAR